MWHKPCHVISRRVMTLQYITCHTHTIHVTQFMSCHFMTGHVLTCHNMSHMLRHVLACQTIAWNENVPSTMFHAMPLLVTTSTLIYQVMLSREFQLPPCFSVAKSDKKIWRNKGKCKLNQIELHRRRLTEPELWRMHNCAVHPYVALYTQGSNN